MKSSSPQNSYHVQQVVAVLKEISQRKKITHTDFNAIVKNHRLPDGRCLTKSELIAAYRELAGRYGIPPFSKSVLKKMRMKPIRSMSGVTPVTVLTKPYPCPGKCIFCPSDVRMPKSYLSDEPGAQRAERNWFDPYLQTYNRLQALYEIGHPLDKVEIIVLGGTWSYYPEKYQIWFIKECFRALNDFGEKDDRKAILKMYRHLWDQLRQESDFVLIDDPESNKKQAALFQKKLDYTDIDSKNDRTTYNQLISKVYSAPEKKIGLDTVQAATWNELTTEHTKNETAQSRCVGLVIETRPDNISPEEVIRIRRFGCTKTQLGIQSLNDCVLKDNKRGHTVTATRKAFELLRQAGFKIHGHWMANLYGSSVKQDKLDYKKLFSDPHFLPDELKIYPCSLIQSAELNDYYQDGRWYPYSYQELLELLPYVLRHTPEYCRLTRIIRDIPAGDIVVGNKKSNFRQIAEQHLKKQGITSQDIRAREIRNNRFDLDAVRLDQIWYATSVSQEVFLQFVIPDNDKKTIIAFLRLSLPTRKPFISELNGAALIREIHVYGPAVELAHSDSASEVDISSGEERKESQKAQHLGFGTRLIQKARSIAADEGYFKLAVISGIGTREYYRKKGFRDGDLYQFIDTR